MNIPRETLIKIINGDQEEIEKIKEKLGFKEKRHCVCCGKEFYPQHRSDEKYCRECRFSGYSQTMSETQKRNRREYKRLHALYRRGRISQEEMKQMYQKFVERGQGIGTNETKPM